MKKKLLVMLVLALSVVLFSGLCSNAMTQSEFNSKITTQKALYPHGSRWTSSFDGGIQCFGFAHMLAYNVFGTKAKTWAKVYSLNNVKAGDVVQFGNTSGSGHTVFVLSVSGDTVTYADCNSDYNCTVKWGNTFSKKANKIWSYTFSYLYSAPTITSYTSVPSTPTIKNILVSGSNVTVSWNAVGQAEKYIVDFWDPNGSHNYFSTTGTSYTQSLADGYYGIRVCAENSLGQSKYTSFHYRWVSNNNIPPQTPVIRELKSEKQDVTVSWNHVEYAGSYIVEFYNTETGVSETCIVDGGLNSMTRRVGNGNYGVRVIAVNTAGVQSATTTYSYINVNYDLVPVSIRNFNGKIYMLFDVGIPWDEAQEYCESIGGNLAVITSNAENEFIKKLISNGSKNGYWIGATDELSEGTWKWVTGEVFSFTDWYTGNPNNTGGREHYLELRKDYGNKWNDDSIDKYLETELQKQGFICELEEPVFNIVVEQQNDAHYVKSDMKNKDKFKCIVSGYKNKKLVDIASFSNESTSEILYGDIDEIKVFVWIESSINPICVNKKISNKEWVIK